MAGREIALRLDLTPEHVSVIRARFRAEGVAGLFERPKAGRKDHAVSAATEARLVEMAMSPPRAGRTRWTTRLLGKQMGLSANCVSKRAAAQQPQASLGADVQGQSRPGLRLEGQGRGGAVPQPARARRKCADNLGQPQALAFFAPR